jgi:hypothetical protein
VNTPASRTPYLLPIFLLTPAIIPSSSGPGPTGRFAKVSSDRISEYVDDEYILASRDIVEENISIIKPLLGHWDIVRLADGYKIDGKGYGNKIMQHGPKDAFGHTLLVKVDMVITFHRRIRRIPPAHPSE